MRLQEPFKSDEGFVVKADAIQILDGDACFLETVLRSLRWKAGIVLAARESLLLGGCHDLAIAHEAGGGIVVEGGDAKDVARHCVRNLDDVETHGDVSELPKLPTPCKISKIRLSR